MQWVVTVQYKGARAAEHGPVSPIDDNRVHLSSVMTCGDAYTTMVFVIDVEGRDEAEDAVTRVANKYAAEVGLPPGPDKVDLVPQETAGVGPV